MKKRIITGAVYIVLIAAVLVMKLLIPATESGLRFGDLGIDLLFWLIAVIGAFEFTRAFDYKSKKAAAALNSDGQETLKPAGISKAQRWVTIVASGLMVPAFVLGKMLAISAGKAGASSEIALVLLLSVGSIGAMVVASLAVFDNAKSSLDSTAYCELCLLYVGALTSVGANINHMMVNSDAAILLLFILVPAVDTWAFFFGKLFGKLLPKKLAPNVSPNKTVIGSIGGILGGVFAAVVVWLICEFTTAVPFVSSSALPAWALLIIISLPTAILAQLGDLFESAVKRGCGIKDMGKILPGHGGVLDRFDSMLFATVSIVVCFMLI